MASQIHVDDIGTQIVLTIKDDDQIVDISSASSLEFIIRKPDTTKHTKTGSLYTDGTDGKMYYASVAGDFDRPGKYKVQGKVTMNSGVYYTSIFSFKVYCNL